MALDLVVSGATGRMGRALGRLIREADDLHALAGIARAAAPADDDYPEILAIEDAGEIIRAAAVVIDFSAPDHLDRLLDHHGDAIAGRALLVGTTALDPDTERRLDELARRAAVLVAPNFSPGITLLLDLVRRAAAALPADGWDVEIVETHHAGKADAPSGTAIALARAAAGGRGVDLEDMRRDGRSGVGGSRPPGEIGIHALRGGAVPGEHVVHLIAARERILLGHQAADRDLFAAGALVAARWVAGRGAGRYGMADVLGL